MKMLLSLLFSMSFVILSFGCFGQDQGKHLSTDAEMDRNITRRNPAKGYWIIKLSDNSAGENQLTGFWIVEGSNRQLPLSVIKESGLYFADIESLCEEILARTYERIYVMSIVGALAEDAWDIFVMPSQDEVIRIREAISMAAKRESQFSRFREAQGQPESADENRQ